MTRRVTWRDWRGPPSWSDTCPAAGWSARRSAPGPATTTSTACSPPFRKWRSACASIRATAGCRADRSFALAVLGLLRHHGYGDDHRGGRRREPGQREGRVERRRQRATVPAELGEASGAPHGQREAERHSDARDERREDNAFEGAPVDSARGQDRHPCAPVAVTGEPCWTRRTKITRSAPSRAVETMMGPSAPVPKIRVMPYTRAPIIADMGSVSTHAMAMLPAMPQRTAENRLAAPAP